MYIICKNQSTLSRLSKTNDYGGLQMLRSKTRFCAIVLTLAMLLSVLAIVPVSAQGSGSGGITEAVGWFESAYAEWSPISGADSYNAYVSEAEAEAWSAIDSALIRKYSSYYRVDAVGLKAGNYRIKIVPVIGGIENASLALTTDILAVLAYDRSGYAHFNYTEGVGAYNDDGTLKSGAIVLYVTEENKNTVTVTSKDGTTVSGIGNILNSVGADVGGGKNSKGGIANTNADIIRKLAEDGTPLVVRIIGNVTAPAGLTAYNSVDYGGSVGDNGNMARMSGGKDITIEGIGSDAVMNGWGLHFICQTADYSNGYGKSFEVRNIAFKNVPEDCIGMEGQQEGSTLTAPVERCWIHNCTFYAPVISNPAESDKSGGDGACDFKRGQYFTNSYCYYYGYHKTNLVGSSDSSLQYHLTYHHNYWKNCESRGPLARQANIHMYNNIFDGQTSYCMNPRANAYIFSEYNMFYTSKTPVDVDSGAVKSYNDSFTSCIGNNHATVVTDRATTVSTSNKYANFDTNPTLSYIPSGNYVIQESISDMKAVVLAYAGTQKENVVTPSEVNTSVIPANHYPTAAMILDYSKAMNKSNVPASGKYDNVVFNVSKLNTEYLGVGGNATGCDIVFYVDTAVNITVTQSSESTSDLVLCDESGKCLLIGSGTVNDLPSGYYFIQSNNYDVGSSKFKEARIAQLTVIAVDPNAATTPIPTPPPVGGDNGGSDDNNPGDDNVGGGENVGGGSVTTGTVITKDSEVHSFADNGTADPESFFTISGNTSTSKGSVTFNGETIKTCLKLESSTKISFKATASGTLVLVFGGSTNASGKKVKVDGVSYEIPSNQILELTLGAGSHEVTKGDSINLFYMAFVPESSVPHTHDFKCTVSAEPTCVASGLLTYTCDCGESYTEVTNALGHSFELSASSDPTCTEEGVITYACACGESYTEKIDALGHSFESSVTKATCTEAGVITYACACGESYTEKIDALGHNFGSFVTEATCTEAGVITYACACGESYTEKIDALGHSFNDGACSVCGEAEPVDTPDEPEKDETPSDDGSSDDGSSDVDEEKLNFFQKIWKAIVDFFSKLFGNKKKA